MRVPKKIIHVEDFEPHTGPEIIERIINKAKPLRDMHVVHVNSTYYGGGVAEVLSSKTLLMNSLGIKTGWRVIQGSPDFFSITKKMHNALQGDRIGLTERKMQIYEDVIYENAFRSHLHHDIVVVHDPQPLAMIRHHRKNGPWIWRCHIDLTRPNPEVMRFLLPYINMYDAVILTLEEYRQKFRTPQVFFFPTINPFSISNRDLTEEEISERLAHYRIPDDLPLVLQVSRFDRWKDPEGVIEAFRIARKKVDCTLVLLGNVATDDPEGEKVYRSLLDNREERIVILSVQDSALVNALQRRATVILQKSLREGFGLTVAEAMWKGTPVIGGNVGGIRYQIEDGKNGFLVSSVQEAADRIVRLVKDKKLNRTMGKRAKETVRKNYLLTSSVERYLDLFGSFKTSYTLMKK
ncbi:MAG: glycosyltransferase [Thermodesulfobacteriota bacterium]|nr:glycosyltransferase [Thermodesulfobacteriota bacterium]